MVALPAQVRQPALLAAAAPVVIEQAMARATPRLGDGQPMPEPYRLRTLPAQNEVAEALGGSVTATASVDAALTWLAAAQEDDGSWDPSRWGGGLELKVAGHDREGAGVDADTGITGLAVLAFLGNGQTHLEGHLSQERPARAGVSYCAAKVRTETWSGRLARYAKMYCHGMASLALSEALAMTGDARILPHVERAVAIHGQSSASDLGWLAVSARGPRRHEPVWVASDGPQERVVGRYSRFRRRLAKACSTSCSVVNTVCTVDLARYQTGRAPLSRAMTAEALVCRYFLDLAPDQTLVTEASDYLLGEVPQAGVAERILLVLRHVGLVPGSGRSVDDLEYGVAAATAGVCRERMGRWLAVGTPIPCGAATADACIPPRWRP